MGSSGESRDKCGLAELLVMGRNIRGHYPEDWKEIAFRVKESAGWRCVRCGHPDEPPWKVQRRIPQWQARTGRSQVGPSPCDERCSHPDNGKQRMLTTAHLDDDKSNCADWNLAALCQVCHLQTQGKIEMRQGWMLGHSGWMAWRVKAMEEARP